MLKLSHPLSQDLLIESIIVGVKSKVDHLSEFFSIWAFLIRAVMLPGVRDAFSGILFA